MPYSAACKGWLCTKLKKTFWKEKTLMINWPSFNDQAKMSAKSRTRNVQVRSVDHTNGPLTNALSLYKSIQKYIYIATSVFLSSLSVDGPESNFECSGSSSYASNCKNITDLVKQLDRSDRTRQESRNNDSMNYNSLQARVMWLRSRCSKSLLQRKGKRIN